jgi:hypothetical protein
MSRELHAFIEAAEPVPRSDLDEACRALGWNHRVFEDLSSFRVSSDAHIRNCEIVIWRATADVHRRADAALEGRDLQALTHLYKKNLVGIVAVDHEMPFSPDLEMIEELREQELEPSLVERVARSNQFYSVRTSAGRSSFSLRVQTMVGNLLAVARYGVFSDPQEGRLESFSQDRIEAEESGSPPSRRTKR